MLINRPKIIVMLAGALLFAIWVNALWFQTGRHPAPLFNAANEVRETSQPVSRPGKGDARTVETASRTGRQDPTTTGLQDGLRTLGFYDGPVDGIDGPRTRMAARLYIVANGLDEGSLSSQDLLAHIRAESTSLKPLPAPPPLTSDAKRIRMVQEVLIRLGYKPGKVDGVFGTATAHAIEQFQRDRSIPVTGRISETLLRELSSVAGISYEEAFAG